MKEKKYCTHCGFIGYPTNSHLDSGVMKKSFIGVLLCIFLLPIGILYFIVNFFRSGKCPSCRAGKMIPLHSPLAQKAVISEEHKGQDIQRPS